MNTGNQPSQSPIEAPDNGGSSSSSLVVGIVVVIVLAILGGLYFWGARLEKATPADEPGAAMVPPAPPAGVPMQVGESVSVADDATTATGTTASDVSDASSVTGTSTGAQAEIQVR